MNGLKSQQLKPKHGVEENINPTAQTTQAKL
jgi:hypothetical protein